MAREAWWRQKPEVKEKARYLARKKRLEKLKAENLEKYEAKMAHRRKQQAERMRLRRAKKKDK